MEGIKTYNIPVVKNYNSNNYSIIDKNGHEFYYSYDTMIAFRKRGCQIVISKNYWSNTTGKHLNAINPDHSIRVDDAEFGKLFTEQFGEVSK